MIVDCHTHIWQSPEQLGRLDLGDLPRSGQKRVSRFVAGSKPSWRTVPAADPDHHWAQSSLVDKSIVLGFTLSPANQDFHPCDSRAMRVYAEAERLNMPILLHPVGQFTEQSKLEFARPYLFDEVLRTFPGLRIIIAQLGQPWLEETICLLGKHANAYADVSGLLSRRWQAYNALVAAHESQVIDKLLFGSDFPYTSVTDCIEALYSINQLAQGTNLPVVPREALRGIIERDALGLLGLA